VGVAQDGSLFVSDLLSGRFTQFTLTGAVARFLQHLSLDAAGRETDPIAVLADGRILATLWQGRPNRGTIAGIQAGAFERDPVPLLVSGGEVGSLDTLAMWQGLERAHVNLDGEESRLPVPFARSAFYDGRGGATAIGIADSLDLWLFEGTTPRLHLMGQSPRRPPTGTEQHEWKERLLTSRPDIGEMVTRAEQGIRSVAALPLVGGLVVDDSSNVWVAAYATPKQERRVWRVFSREGQLLGKVVLPVFADPLLPSRTELLDVCGDRIALLREDADGALNIEVRAVSRK
jgi:hypothetical protein